MFSMGCVRKKNVSDRITILGAGSLLDGGRRAGSTEDFGSGRFADAAGGILAAGCSRGI
jgi:hypothetical protein